tara:strand:- start:611 stop:910 length:300 start_codon:yes stop_codon:yes gene_type:complete
MVKLSTKRSGARYGARLKKKLAEIESQQKTIYPCPYCTYIKVKRVSMGIWKCNKCDAKFSSKAYSVGKVGIKLEEGQEESVLNKKEDIKVTTEKEEEEK